MIVIGVLLVLATQTSSTTTVGPSLRDRLLFNGNGALSDEVYLALLESRGVVGTASASVVRDAIDGFLHGAGYDLATVDVTPRGKRLWVDLDEGRLDRVIFRGEGVFETFRLQLGVDLPFQVYNRPLLARQLQVIAERLGLVDYRWEIVPAETVRRGLQLDDIEDLRASPLDLLPRRHELHVQVRPVAWSVGLAPELLFSGVDGLVLGMRLRGASLFLEGDRWSAHLRAGGAIRTAIREDGPVRPVLTRGLAIGRWISPPLSNSRLTIPVGARFDFFHRQRRDVDLESIYGVRPELTADLDFAFAPEGSLRFGAGIEYLHLFELEPATPGAPVTSDIARTRVFGAAGLRIHLNPNAVRVDRPHTFDFELRYFRAVQGPGKGAVQMSGEYRRTFVFGWHELRIGLTALHKAGDVPYPDEVSVGEYLRGPFGERFYSRTVGAATFDLRISVVRELLKIGVFHDGAVFGLLDATRTQEKAAIANAFGPSVHLLILESLQVEAFIGFGFGPGGIFENGLSLQMRQAF